MMHRDLETDSSCPGYLQPRYWTDTTRVLEVFECDGCGLTNCPAVARRLRAVWRRLLQRGRIQQTVTESAMNRPEHVLRLCGAILSNSAIDPLKVSYGDVIAQAYRIVDDVLDPGDEPEPATSQAVPKTQPVQQPAAEPRRWNPDDVPPPGRHRPEPGYGEDPPPRGQNGYGRQQQRNGQRDDPPRSGKQLLGWANSHGQYESLLALAKAWKIQGRIVDWSQNDVDAAHRELTQPAQPAGNWGGN